jgi:hypothetical protein
LAGVIHLSCFHEKRFRKFGVPLVGRTRDSLVAGVLVSENAIRAGALNEFAYKCVAK